MPRWEEFNKKKIFKYACETKKFADYLPDYGKKVNINRNFLFNIMESVEKDYISNKVDS